MKFEVVSILLLACTCFAEIRRDDVWPPKRVLNFLQPIRTTCMEKTGVAAEAIQEFSDGEVHDDPKLKCYMNCIFDEASLLDANGDVHFEKIVTHIEKWDAEIREIAKNFIAACKNIVGDDPCERAFSVHKCWKMEDPKHYFLV